MNPRVCSLPGRNGVACATGPSGTGKSESSKELMQALGWSVYMISGDGGLSVKAFRSLIQYQCLAPGIALCFDELLKLDVATLHQCMQIAQASASKRRDPSFIVYTYNSDSQATKEQFLNQGASNKLFSAFASIKMSVGTEAIELVTAVMYMAQGIAPSLSADVNATGAMELGQETGRLFEWAKDHLSRQEHYDFGWRQLESFIGFYGQVERDAIAQTMYLQFGRVQSQARPTDRIHILKVLFAVFQSRQLIAFDAMKLCEHLGLPSLNLPLDVLFEMDTKVLRVVEHAAADALGGVPSPGLVRALVNLKISMQLRPCTIMQTAHAQELLSVLISVTRELASADGLFSGVSLTFLRTEGLNGNELYGEMRMMDGEWTWCDGQLPLALKKAEGPTWIVMEGPCDDFLYGDLLTLMDRDRKLLLANGESVPLPSEVKVVYVTNTLTTASKRFTSRCNIVLLDAADAEIEAALGAGRGRENAGESADVQPSLAFPSPRTPRSADEWSKRFASSTRSGSSAPVSVSAVFASAEIKDKPQVGTEPTRISMTKEPTASVHLAAMLEQWDDVERLAPSQLERLCERDEFGHLPLHWAVVHSNWAAVQRLAQLSPESLDCTTSYEDKAIHLAVRTKDWEGVESLAYLRPSTLLDADLAGLLPIHRCFHSPIEDTSDGGAAGVSEHRSKIFQGSEGAVIEALVVKMATLANETVKAPNPRGRTPLHYAAESKRWTTARALLKLCPASAKVIDKHGWLAFHIALYELTRMVVAGARPDPSDDLLALIEDLLDLHPVSLQQPVPGRRGVLGSIWKWAGPRKPTTGNEIVNKALSQAVRDRWQRTAARSSVSFAVDEVGSFQVADLTFDSYIMVDAGPNEAAGYFVQGADGHLPMAMLARSEAWQVFNAATLCYPASVMLAPSPGGALLEDLSDADSSCTARCVRLVLQPTQRTDWHLHALMRCSPEVLQPALATGFAIDRLDTLRLAAELVRRSGALAKSERELDPQRAEAIMMLSQRMQQTIGRNRALTSLPRSLLLSYR